MKRTKRESFPLQVSDVPKQFDILFIGSADHLGEVLAKAGRAGRHAIEQLLPKYHIAWHHIDAADWPRSLPDDWQEFCFIVPPAHRLSQRLLALEPLETLGPDDFAFLLMQWVNENDSRVRVGCYSIAECEFTIVRDPKQSN